jgi:hypothetical protein
MSSDPPSTSGADDLVVAMLRCGVCGRAIEVRESQGTRYIKTDSWPLCCTQAMLHFTFLDKPTKQ